MHSATVKLELSSLKFDQYRYLVATQMAVLARRDPDPFKSLSLWNNNLKQQDWHTFLPEFLQGDLSGTGSLGAPDDRPVKKSWPNDPYTLQDNQAPTQAADNDKPLWTEEDFT
ncbi:hypothetical protein PtA15_9A356 [Puccinia triticina]|uniref:AGC-kinase C-terminal domain-containing protein n=1 Tax=Puccinia triticina TaxID=208348 RepID=A0ABY7CSH3_9BASI|nr:uncharacterized protein PtA15_9A356 [Puccinia triticina]WAQ88229.1 hypothetical protein PtA15_9A356 [Puccinia triticina]